MHIPVLIETESSTIILPISLIFSVVFLQLNGTITSSGQPLTEKASQQLLKAPLAEKSVSSSLCSGSGSGSGGNMNSHKLVPESFSRPTKCLICASLLLGQQWQGLRCQQCGFVCHLQCRQAAASLSCNLSPTSATPSEMPSFGELFLFFNHD